MDSAQKVVVVGARATGLATARQMTLGGLEPVVFEAARRLGGTRLNTEELESDPPGRDPDRLRVHSPREGSFSLGASIVYFPCMEASPARIHAPLGFAKPGDVSEDHERPGMLRARTLPLNSDPNEVFDYETCLLHDLAAASAPEPRLEEAGFQMIDLSGNEQLQNTLIAIRNDDQIEDDTAQALRAILQAARLPLGKGRSLRVEYVADEGHDSTHPTRFDEADRQPGL